ncbi:hypothetical protein B0H13DRAFT_2277842 [Mycena leptocephala]|nr:hypothetical protein B0H13DRAFT_2277842 [Mycena leptocephala]
MNFKSIWLKIVGSSSGCSCLGLFIPANHATQQIFKSPYLLHPRTDVMSKKPPSDFSRRVSTRDDEKAHHGAAPMRWEQMTTVKQFLDGRFRVRGVSSLRIVDMSSWPDASGFFPTTPPYMFKVAQNVEENSDVRSTFPYRDISKREKATSCVDDG